MGLLWKRALPPATHIQDETETAPKTAKKTTAAGDAMRVRLHLNSYTHLSNRSNVQAIRVQTHLTANANTRPSWEDDFGFVCSRGSGVSALGIDKCHRKNVAHSARQKRNSARWMQLNAIKWNLLIAIFVTGFVFGVRARAIQSVYGRYNLRVMHKPLILSAHTCFHICIKQFSNLFIYWSLSKYSNWVRIYSVLVCRRCRHRRVSNRMQWWLWLATILRIHLDSWRNSM